MGIHPGVFRRADVDPHRFDKHAQRRFTGKQPEQQQRRGGNDHRRRKQQQRSAAEPARAANQR
jgi:hypothetical protein